MTSSAPMFFNFGKTTFDKVSTDVFYCQFEFRSYFIFVVSMLVTTRFVIEKIRTKQ
jgi:hypothetical protein